MESFVACINIQELLDKVYRLSANIAKRREDSKVMATPDDEAVVLDHLRTAVDDVLMLANMNRVVLACDYDAVELVFSISPIRRGKEHLLDLLTSTIRQNMANEVVRLWMMTVRPEWADASMRESLRQNIKDVMCACTSMGNKVRRRATTMGI